MYSSHNHPAVHNLKHEQERVKQDSIDATLTKAIINNEKEYLEGERLLEMYIYLASHLHLKELIVPLQDQLTIKLLCATGFVIMVTNI